MLDKLDNKAMTARLDAAIDSAIAEKRIVGTVLIVGRERRVVYRARRGPGRPRGRHADARGRDLPAGVGAPSRSSRPRRSR